MIESISELRTFVRVVESGGFSVAARTLGVSTAMVSKSIAGLEERLGVRLLDRNTRKTSPTEAGARFYERCVALLRALGEAENELVEDSGRAKGHLRASVPVELAAGHLADLVPVFLARHPELALSLLATNRMVDLVEDGIDVAVRVVRDYDSSLAGRQLGVTSLFLVASPAYVAAHGAPRTPEEVRDHPAVVYGDPNPWVTFGWSRGEARGSFDLTPRLVTSSGDVLRSAVLRGTGIGVLHSMVAGDHLRRGDLVHLLPEHDLGQMRMFALYPHRRHLPVKVRAFVDFLVACFGGDAQADPFLLGLHRPSP